MKKWVTVTDGSFDGKGLPLPITAMLIQLKSQLKRVRERKRYGFLNMFSRNCFSLTISGHNIVQKKVRYTKLCYHYHHALRSSRGSTEWPTRRLSTRRRSIEVYRHYLDCTPQFSTVKPSYNKSSAHLFMP